MADERLRIRVEADAKRAEQDLEQLADLADVLSEDTISILVNAKTDAAEAEVKRLTKLLQTAQDPVDIKVITTGIKQARDEIESLGRITPDASKKIDDLGRSADGSRSVLANMIGNSVQDLGALGGVAGSAGVAFGQMGEYMADATFAGDSFSQVLSNFGKVLGPVIALSVGIAAASAAWKAYNANSKETARLTGELSDALSDQTGVLDDMKDNVGDASDTWSLLNRALAQNKEFPKAAQALGRIGQNSKNLSRILAALEDDADGALSTLARGAGIPRDLANAIGYAVGHTENFKGAMQLLTDQGLGPAAAAYEDQIRALEDLNDAQQDFDLETVAREQLNLAAAVDDTTRALVEQARADVGPDGTSLQAWEKFVELQSAATTGAGLFEAGIKGAAGIIGDAADELRDQADAHREAADAAREHLGLFKTYADAVLERVDAEATLQEVLGDSASTMEAQRDAIIEVAEARVEEKKLAEEASGRTFDEADAVDELNWQLLNMAKGLDGPTKRALGNYIANLNGIPEQEATEILTLIDEGKFDEAAARLAEVSTSRDVALNADAHTAAADAELDTLTAPRTVQVDVVARGLERFTSNITTAINNALGGRSAQSTAARYVWRNGRYVEVG